MNSDYMMVAKAISYFQHNTVKPSGFSKVAAEIGLEPEQFRQILQRWSGVTSTQFFHYLTIDTAKQRLIQPCIDNQPITFEAMTPRQYKNTGMNLSIKHGVCSSPFGYAFIATTERGICQLSFSRDQNTADCMRRLRKKWPSAELTGNTGDINSLAEMIFNNSDNRHADLSLIVLGSEFQIKVWRALLHIPSGKLFSYRQIARIIGHPTSSRAVANAIGANPVAYLIPCHRVIRSSGALGGYGGGIERKQAMLVREFAEQDRCRS